MQSSIQTAPEALAPTAAPAAPTAPEPTPETRFRCRHIHVSGTRCGSPCLRREPFCYFHHTTRPPVTPAQVAARAARRADFALPMPEDRAAIQLSIGEVLQRIAANQLDPRRAGLLLYGLQIASLNLPRPQPAASRAEAEAEAALETVEEITVDPELGTLAPRADIEAPPRHKGSVQLLLEKYERQKNEKELEERNEAEERRRNGLSPLKTMPPDDSDFPSRPKENAAKPADSGREAPPPGIVLDDIQAVSRHHRRNGRSKPQDRQKLRGLRHRRHPDHAVVRQDALVEIAAATHQSAHHGHQHPGISVSRKSSSLVLAG